MQIQRKERLRMKDNKQSQRWPGQYWNTTSDDHTYRRPPTTELRKILALTAPTWSQCHRKTSSPNRSLDDFKSLQMISGERAKVPTDVYHGSYPRSIPTATQWLIHRDPWPGKRSALTISWAEVKVLHSRVENKHSAAQTSWLTSVSSRREEPNINIKAKHCGG